MEEVKQYRKFLTKILRSQTGWPVDGKNGTYTLTFLKRKMSKIKPLDGAVAIKLKGTFQLRRCLVMTKPLMLLWIYTPAAFMFVKNTSKR